MIKENIEQYTALFKFRTDNQFYRTEMTDDYLIAEENMIFVNSHTPFIFLDGFKEKLTSCSFTPSSTGHYSKDIKDAKVVKLDEIKVGTLYERSEFLSSQFNPTHNEDIVSKEAAGLNEDGSEIQEQSAGMKIN